jgi:hypothetical protein
MGSRGNGARQRRVQGLKQSAPDVSPVGGELEESVDVARQAGHKRQRQEAERPSLLDAFAPPPTQSHFNPSISLHMRLSLLKLSHVKKGWGGFSVAPLVGGKHARPLDGGVRSTPFGGACADSMTD